MASLAEIRQQYPQYSDMSDADLAGAMHRKFYSDMPRADFDAKLGINIEQPNIGMDAAKSFGSGVAGGVTSMAGTGGDIGEAVRAGGDLIPGADQMRQEAIGLNPMLGKSPLAGKMPWSKPGAPGKFTSKEIGGAVDRAAGAPITSYKPETTAGEFAKTIGGFVPLAATGGGGMLRGAIMPGVLSEAAGQATKGTVAETPARVLGALSAGFVPRATGKALAGTIGWLGTGTGGQSIKTAYQSGVKGGEAGQAFRDNMRKNVDQADVVADARTALGNLRVERGKQYNQGMAGVRADDTVLSFKDIDDAVVNATKVKQFKGQELSKSTAEVRNEIQKTIDDWKQLDPADFHTPSGIDALKQKIGDIRDTLPFNTPARKVAEDVYGAIRNTVAKQAPGYAKTMKGYERGSKELSEIEKTLSLNPKASVDTSLRKLQTVMRNNVNTNYGKRADLAQKLAENGAPNLMEGLAGQSLNSIVPRGLARLSGPMAGVAAFSNPWTLATLPFMSPRLVGEGAHLAGRGVGLLSKPAQMVRKAVGASPVPQINMSRDAMLAALAALQGRVR